MATPMSTRARVRHLLALSPALSLAGCIDIIDDLAFCADSAPPLPVVERPVTWHADVAPIIAGRCERCHSEGEIAPFPLTSYDEAYAARAPIRNAVVARSMPPWLPAGCCNTFFEDFSLTPEQIALVDAWVEQGAPEGDPASAAPPLEPVGGLSRVDVSVEMREGYTPQPAAGRVDDFRCFVLDWPHAEPAFVTGLMPVPGERQLVHHLVVATLGPERASALRALEGQDGRPGFPCEGGLGAADVEQILGGSLQGGDYPEGLGTPIQPGQSVLLNIHYSLAGVDAAPDKTRVDFRLSPSATEVKTLPIANPMWLLGDAMRIPAGAEDHTVSYQYDPVLLTGGETVMLRGFTPHMHALGSRIKAAIVREGGAVECLTEMPAYDYGWEQPVWFAEPIAFRDGDQLYLQCHFDNSADNQPVVGGEKLAPKDVAWGVDNQEMCAGFVRYTVGR